MKHILLLAAAGLVLGCTQAGDAGRQHLLQGAWTLRQMDYPIGSHRTFAETEGTLLRLYDGDTLMCQCWLTRTETGLLVRPIEQLGVRLIDQGHGEHIYLEDGDPHPLTVRDDTTIVIQHNGILHTWHRDDELAAQWGADIRALTAKHAQAAPDAQTPGYVLSARERRQAGVIQWLAAATTAVLALLLLVARVAADNRRARRRLQLQLQQIREASACRAPLVRRAMASVEGEYFASDDYQSLQRRIATGQLLRAEDWSAIEAQLRRVYPGFGSQLRGLRALSELEYRVCLLVKLRIAPSDIAAVLARDASTISTVRSRLYKKVFHRKGGAREWDEFILSM